jgi:threonine/homoserine/homoserine lactone efflux protein
VRDRHYGALTALGVLTGNLIHIGYCVVGIAVLVSRNPVLFLFYLGVFTQVITPDMSLTQMALLIVVMMTVSAMFWVIFVQTLRLPAVRAGVSGWRAAINRVFGLP